ncbi:phosphatase PAP2 family protein [Ideonella livida]|uniref:Phosphatase PAP2 family protein n=1 Tax=Ideonella livida TaxID=2707176 RepID=A0A7C9PKA8_9BURK|nr:phosphatase PAP2 family protein [Ideonella livida]NDY93849.1 phosphatase PAP2 family protein [Ideonella livida]
MPATATPVPPAPLQPFLLLHALAIPLALASAGLAAHFMGWDLRLAQWAFDPVAGGFPARQWDLLELLGHRLAKSAVLLLWCLLVAAAVAGRWVGLAPAQRRLLGWTALAMAAGPTLVVVLKELNSAACPWSLEGLGGHAAYRLDWFVGSAQAGRCFPGGHAAGGFCLVALVFAARHQGRADWERAALVLTVGCGLIFSAVRMAQGAHFLSHNLWAAALDWACAALVFTPLLRRQRRGQTATDTRPYTTAAA